MTGTVQMPPKKKVNEPPPDTAAERPVPTEFSAQVKLREAFKIDLQTVAVRLKMPMGDLIERLIYQQVETMLELSRRGRPLPVPPPRPEPGSGQSGR